MTTKTLGGHAGDLIWRATRRKRGLGRLLHKAASIYVRAFEDRGDNPQWNGEHHLLRAVARLGAVTIFDVGANVGEWTGAALKLTNAQIHAFELSPATAQALERRFSSNPRVKANPFGLSDALGQVQFRSYPGQSTLNSLLVEKSFHRIDSEVVTGRVMTGDEYCAERGINHIDFLKVDAEGADHLVLRGFTKMLAEHRVRVVQFEYGYAATTSRFILDDFVDFFRASGYRLGPLRSQGVDVASRPLLWNNFESGPNFVAARADDAEAWAAIRSPAEAAR